MKEFLKFNWGTFFTFFLIIFSFACHDTFVAILVTKNFYNILSRNIFHGKAGQY